MKIRIDVDTKKFTTEIAVLEGDGFNSKEPFIFGYANDLKELCQAITDDIDMIVSASDEGSCYNKGSSTENEK